MEGQSNTTTQVGLPTGFKLAIGASIFIGLAVGGYFIYDYVSGAKVKPEEDKGDKANASKSGAAASASESSSSVAKQSTGGGSSPKPSKPASGDSFPLSNGSKGPNAKRLQQALNHFYRKFQENKVSEDGAIGDKTWAIVQKAYGKNKNEVVEGDITWLNTHTKEKTGVSVDKDAPKIPAMFGGVVLW